MIATITLNPSIDQHIFVNGLVKDDVNRATAVIEYPGGKGVNVSKVVRELGGPTRAYALLGGRTGGLLQDLLAGLDTQVSAFPVKGATRVNAIITDTKDGTQTRVSAPGPWVSRRLVRQFERRLWGIRPKPFVWALGGSLSAGMPDATYYEIILALQRRGVPCILDTDGAALKWGLKARPFMIKPNEFEISRLLGCSFRGLMDYLRAGRELVRQGVRVVVISLAAEGALFVTEQASFHVAVPQVAVNSKVGAGDSLIGGFALGLYRKYTLKDAARLGVAASVSSVLRESPRLCRRSDIPRLLPKLKIKDLS